MTDTTVDLTAAIEIAERDLAEAKKRLEDAWPRRPINLTGSVLGAEEKVVTLRIEEHEQEREAIAKAHAKANAEYQKYADEFDQIQRDYNERISAIQPRGQKLWEEKRRADGVLQCWTDRANGLASNLRRIKGEQEQLRARR